jgi:hypothetical protein
MHPVMQISLTHQISLQTSPSAILLREELWVGVLLLVAVVCLEVTWGPESQTGKREEVKQGGKQGGKGRANREGNREVNSEVGSLLLSPRF